MAAALSALIAYALFSSPALIVFGGASQARPARMPSFCPVPIIGSARRTVVLASAARRACARVAFSARGGRLPAATFCGQRSAELLVPASALDAAVVDRPAVFARLFYIAFFAGPRTAALRLPAISPETSRVLERIVVEMRFATSPIL